MYAIIWITKLRYEVLMKNKQPPFQITNKIIDEVAEISELTGRLSARDHLSSNPNLRRTNRIRTIHGSLAIEQNTLSLEQVTAVLNGKHVLAPDSFFWYVSLADIIIKFLPAIRWRSYIR